MENNSKLSYYKEQVDSLVTDVFNDYLKLETDSQKTIKSLTDQLDSLNAEHDSKIESLQSNLDNAKQDLTNRDTIIDDLQQKINSVTEETSENKFDIIRGQSKEIAAKDKEIIRLREEVVKMKDGGVDNKNIGWSPTSSPTPAPTEVATLEVATVEVATVEVATVEVATVDDGHVESNKGIHTDPDKDSVSNIESDEEEYELITYRKTTYYLNKDKVYEIVKDEDGDDDVGDCVGDWVKQTSGKFKLIKH